MNDRRLKRRGSKNGQPVWTAILPLPRGAGGKRRQYRFTFIGTKKGAEKALVDELARIGSDTFVAPDSWPTFAQYMRAFLDGARPTYTRKHGRDLIKLRACTWQQSSVT